MSYQHPTFDRYRLQTMGWLEEEKCDGQLYHPLLDIELFVLPRTFNLELLNAYLTSIHALALNFHFNLILHPSSCTLLQVSKTPRFFFFLPVILFSTSSENRTGRVEFTVFDASRRRKKELCIHHDLTQPVVCATKSH